MNMIKITWSLASMIDQWLLLLVSNNQNCLKPWLLQLLLGNLGFRSQEQVVPVIHYTMGGIAINVEGRATGKSWLRG